MNGNTLAALFFALASLLLIEVRGSAYDCCGSFWISRYDFPVWLVVLVIKIFLMVMLPAPIFLVAHFSWNPSRQTRNTGGNRIQYHLSTFVIVIFTTGALLNPVIKQCSYSLRGGIGTIFLCAGVIVLITDAWEYLLRQRARRISQSRA